MTFDQIVTACADRLNLTTSTATTRLGLAVNRVYKKVTTAVGISALARRSVAASANTSIGSTTVTFTGVEKITRVYDDTSGTIRQIDEVTFDELRDKNPGTGQATEWAVQSQTSSTVVIRLNSTAQSVYALKADGFATTSTLSGSNEPAFPESFHDILVEGVLYDEYKKLEKVALAKESKAEYEQRLSDLRMWHAKTISPSFRQGKNESAAFGSGTSGGGGANSGNQAYTQTANIHFNTSGTDAPFTVESGSAVVTNLDADMLDGFHETSFAKLADNETVAGTWTFTNAVTLTNGQLVFPAAQNASAGANTLDDYEEGSVNTMTFGGSGGQSGQVYSLQVGRYIKVGKNVFVYGRITLSTLGTITGDVEIQGLPFTSENVTDGFAPINIGFFSAMTSTYVFLSGYVSPNSTKATLVGLTAAATGTGTLAQANLSNTTSIIFSVTYRASA